MKKFLLSFFLISSVITLAETEEILIDKIYPNENAVILSGEREAKNNVTTTFFYEENKTYNIYCRVNNITTLMLNPDEQIISIDAGDTSRWTVKEVVTGSVEGQRSAVVIKPLSFNADKMLKTTINIFTNKRYYNLSVLSAREWYNPIVKWIYPQEIQLAQKQKLETEEELTRVDPSKLNYNYSVSTKKYEFVPSTIFDDGTKTYFVMKENLQELPALYMQEGNKLLLVNYRVKGNYLIVDRTFKEGALILGKKKVVVKKRGE
ncbi:MAG: TrbG/VirB9 family P-type conjugative transfer protein [Fusobacterium varium]|uniref:TrbG/VirB9 family P-type conjugative transfer protein n=1 Tax=Fusobacterium varium TaxID=856 RepID=UPI0024320978|nr:TrbG/VirB9 family P-type conjugative transfer protein [Fusobacterium varium]MCF0171878.1 TrbG/VirB9 family P-type conjugative transfer protein [Fusobacterium varium]